MLCVRTHVSVPWLCCVWAGTHIWSMAMLVRVHMCTWLCLWEHTCALQRCSVWKHTCVFHGYTCEYTNMSTMPLLVCVKAHMHVICLRLYNGTYVYTMTMWWGHTCVYHGFACMWGHTCVYYGYAYVWGHTCVYYAYAYMWGHTCVYQDNGVWEHMCVYHGFACMQGHTMCTWLCVCEGTCVCTITVHQ